MCVWVCECVCVCVCVSHVGLLACELWALTFPQVQSKLNSLLLSNFVCPNKHSWTEGVEWRSSSGMKMCFHLLRWQFYWNNSTNSPKLPQSHGKKLLVYLSDTFTFMCVFRQYTSEDHFSPTLKRFRTNRKRFFTWLKTFSHFTAAGIICSFHLQSVFGAKWCSYLHSGQTERAHSSIIQFSDKTPGFKMDT